MTKDEALDLALEALEVAVGDDAHDYPKYSEALTAIKQARSAPVQEPVAKVVINAAGQISIQTPDGNAFDVSKHIGAVFYTHPALAAQRQWMGLTTEEMATCIDEPSWDLILRKAEQILKEKNA